MSEFNPSHTLELDRQLNGSTSSKHTGNAAERLNIYQRHYMKTVKITRTIADLEVSSTARPAHIDEALKYRRQEQPVSIF